MKRIEDKVAIITGGANGIGTGIVERFLAEGAKVVAFDIDKNGLDELAQKLDDKNLKCFEVDITDDAAVKACVQRVADTYGRIDILVNDAARFVLKGVEATPQDWQDSFSVNVFGAASCTKHVSEIMTSQKSGAIVNITSISGFVAQPQFLTYSATKAAILQITRNLALDLGKYGIRVNSVSPGAIITRASERHAKKEGMTLEEFIAQQSQNTVINKVGSPADVASAVLFLASEDEAGFVTGANLMVDGGYVIV